jgi:hypothetical protein
MNMGALSQGVELPGDEAHHSPLISGEVNNTWIYTSLLSFAIIMIVVVAAASVVYWSEFLATDPEARVRFPALPEKKE